MLAATTEHDLIVALLILGILAVLIFIVRR